MMRIHFIGSWLFALAIVAFGLVPAYGQHNHDDHTRCYSDELREQAFQENPNLLLHYQQVQDAAQDWLAQNAPVTGGDAVDVIPVVIHVIKRPPVMDYLFSDQVLPQIDILNQDFRRTNADANLTPAVFQPVAVDTEIEFCLADTDPDGNYTSGITWTETDVVDIGSGPYYSTAAGGKDIWDPNRYLNIWVCEIGGGVLGFAYVPGSAPAGRDGVVIDYRYFGLGGYATPPYNMGRTTTHEVGHFFNLGHLWGAGGCVDDGIPDTPIQETFTAGCPDFPQFSCNNEADGGNMFMNYMDYTNDACMNLFTQGQKDAMKSVLASSRNSLLSSPGCQLNGIRQWRGSDLSGNLNVFPNPSEGQFRANFELPEPMPVTVKVFDLMGREVVSFVNEHFLMGSFDIDLSGQPGGLYLLEVQSPIGVASKKVQVLEH